MSRLSAATALSTAVILAPACALRVAPGSYAADDWRRVVSLPSGAEIRLWRTEAKPPDELLENFRGVRWSASTVRVSGRIARIDGASITVRTGTEVRTFSRTEVRRIDVLSRGPDNVKNGSIIGASIGGAVGFLLTAYAAGTSDPVGSSPIFAGVAIGAGIGALADLAHSGPRVATIYISDR